MTTEQSLLSGGIAASVAAALTTPMDVVKTKLMTHRTGDYNKLIPALKKIWSEESIKGFFRGIRIRTVSLGMTGSIFFLSYESAKNLLSKSLLIKTV